MSPAPTRTWADASDGDAEADGSGDAGVAEGDGEADGATVAIADGVGVARAGDGRSPALLGQDTSVHTATSRISVAATTMQRGRLSRGRGSRFVGHARVSLPGTPEGMRDDHARRADVPLPRCPMEHARVVVIGGGVGGTSIAYHLAERGWTDIVLVDRAELTCGSTFHSAGLVGQLRGR